MKYSNSLLLPVLAIVVSPFIGVKASFAEQAPAIKPNIIVIIADDLGYGDIEPYGQKYIKTPHLNKMAEQGIRFTQHYSGSTVCGPSRASLLTGLHTGNSPIRANPKWSKSGKPVNLPKNGDTIASMLKDNGYKTALIGKWGLSENKQVNLSNMPLAQGFDYFFGYRTHGSAHHYYWPTMYKNNEEYELEGNDFRKNQGQYTHDVFTKQALNYITEQDNKKPFFMQIAYTIPHLALTVPEDAKEQYKDLGWPKRMLNTEGHYRNDAEGNVTYAAMVSRMDRDIGKIISTLKQKGLDKNTLILFTSDNGHEYDRGFFNSSGSLKGHKRDLYEGGIRVPLIAYWPNKITTKRTSDHKAAFWDYMPTFCQLAGSSDCPVTDGVSFAPTLLGDKNQAEHDYLYWEFNEGKRGPMQAVIKDDWKLIKFHNKSDQLYNLANDINEENDLAKKHPEVTQQLLKIIKNARSDNPEYPLEVLPNASKKNKNKNKKNRNKV